MSAKKVAFIYSSELDKYSYPPEHPFNTIRAKRVMDVLKSMNLLTGPERSILIPVPAGRVALKKFHTARYLHALNSAGKGRFDVDALNMGIGTEECPIFKGVYEYSALAAGATLVGAKQILEGKVDIAFNPSGGYHHAGPETAAGFCYINDVALACLFLTQQKKKVLYLDVDVHNGDGVANAFYNRSDCMTISMHQNPKTLFPFTGFEDEIGEEEGKGYCVNIPLPVGTYDQAYMKAFDIIVLPLIRVYKPDVIVFELGADALAGDPLGNLQLTNNVYAEIINHLLSFNKPILATGGGGYHIGNTVRAWALAWSVFCGEDEGEDMNLGLGGVMLETTEWQGGFRDRRLTISPAQREAVLPALDDTIKKLREILFPIHGL
ncbi:MAG: acetoin utilization protein AcuC [Sedimentisphaerales bacterium]|nr:acetoin utilization protein AcuC [Sedimentisphaerales bacterium]